ncbi:MAG: DUF4918 family protein [Ignavibacteriaceae bacterium]|nr:DUF4918 family protein [Ignavibacteriaceae bacterium]
MMSFSTKAIKYFNNLKTPKIKNLGIEIISPYEKTVVKEIVKKFYSKFYADEMGRIFMLGINPGRFGGGLTGIAFTDPVALRESCGIENSLGNRKELSSKFIYSVAEKFAGADKFFSKVFPTALYPFAIIKDGKNYNYYDDKSLADKLKTEIIKTVELQIEFGARRDFAILLGKRNAEFFYPINENHKFFNRIFVLEHPRYIMQYKLKQIDRYIKKYIDTINFKQ